MIVKGVAVCMVMRSRWYRSGHGEASVEVSVDDARPHCPRRACHCATRLLAKPLARFDSVGGPHIHKCVVSDTRVSYLKWPLLSSTCGTPHQLTAGNVCKTLPRLAAPQPHMTSGAVRGGVLCRDCALSLSRSTSPCRRFFNEVATTFSHVCAPGQ